MFLGDHETGKRWGIYPIQRLKTHPYPSGEKFSISLWSSLSPKPESKAPAQIQQSLRMIPPTHPGHQLDQVDSEIKNMG